MAESTEGPATAATSAATATTFRTILDEVLRDIKLLRGTAPRELWWIYLMILIDGFAHFSLSYSIVLFMGEVHNYNDVDAAWAFGIYGVLMSLYGLTLGFVIDVLGVRVTLICANVVLLVGRTLLAVTKNTSLALFMLYGLIPVGESLQQPAMATGMRRYTNKSNRSMGFSLFYVAMNVGALLAAPLVDLTRYFAPDGGVLLGLELTPYQIIILVGGLSTSILLVVSTFIKEIDVSENGDTEKYVVPKESPVAILASVLRTKKFWRFALLMLLLVGSGMIFRHLDATYPKWQVRTDPSVPFGSILSINPFMIIFLVPMLTPMTKTQGQFNMILIGTLVTGLSVLPLCLSNSTEAAVTFVAILAVGEALWSPRVFEYTSMIAPKGTEGTYMALSSAPNFLAKVVVGGVSGWLFEKYCPALGQCDGHKLWTVVFLMTISSPILLFMLRDQLRDEDIDGEEQADQPEDEKALLGDNKTPV